MIYNFDELLDELSDYVHKQDKDINLTEQEEKRYIEIIETLKTNNIEIPFGVEI